MKALFSLMAILVLVLGSCNPEHGSELDRWQKHVRNTTIIRDNWGIPHIYGKTDADAVFGLIYAQCEDDFNRVEVNYINSMGRMAEVAGESQIFTDLRMKLFIDTLEVKKEYESSPVWLKELMNAFADGINYYLYVNPDVEPKLIKRFEPWMALTFSEGSIGGDIETISANGLRRFYDKAELQTEVAELVIDYDQEPRGSNGFAIGPSNTVSGNSLLLINPHTSFYFRTEAHMISKEGLNAYGAVTWGQFFIYQGFNEYNGWMHTSSRADAIDHYAETVVEKEGAWFYKYGDELRPFAERKVIVPFTNGDSVDSREFTVYYSHHGPVIREEDGKWISVKLMAEHVKALTQSYTRTKAKGYEDFRKTMELNTNSSNNTVYADKFGNIAYYHGNFIPVRDVSFDWSGVVDGSIPATEWQGLHTVDEMILIHNPGNGWIQNCNSTPFTASGIFSPKKEDYPGYMAPDSENARGLHAVKVLEGKTDFTIESLIEAAYDPYLTAFEEMTPSLVKAYDEISAQDPLKSKLAEPVEMLRSWDLRFSEQSIPTSLAIFWGQQMMNEARSLRGAPGVSIFDLIANEATTGQKLNGLMNAVEKLTEDFGTWKIAWGEINRFQRINGDIVQPFNDDLPSLPVAFASSRWGSLASFGSRAYPGTKKMYGTSGNSFVAVVEFGDKIRAKSIVTGGQSSDPESSHFDDQALMYTRAIFKDVLFYRDDVKKNAERIYHPGSVE
ncbi:MAG TPA: acylase [Bacteroidales bacterium]|nr:acylase [Bacteroidales bacterium]